MSETSSDSSTASLIPRKRKFFASTPVSTQAVSNITPSTSGNRYLSDPSCSRIKFLNSVENESESSSYGIQRRKKRKFIASTPVSTDENKSPNAAKNNLSLSTIQQSRTSRKIVPKPSDYNAYQRRIDKIKGIAAPLEQKVAIGKRVTLKMLSKVFSQNCYYDLGWLFVHKCGKRILDRARALELSPIKNKNSMSQSIEETQDTVAPLPSTSKVKPSIKITSDVILKHPYILTKKIKQS